MDIEKKPNKILYLLLFLGVIGLFLLGMSSARLESEVEISGTGNLAEWEIFINNEDVTSIEQNIEITDISWSTSHTREGKVSPGSTGEMEIYVNASNTQVAVIYTFDIVDKSVNPNQVLTVTSMTSDNSTLVKTGPHTYTGLLSLSDISSDKTPHIHVELEWEDDPNINDFERSIGSLNDFLKISFNAKQYIGEVITPYSGG